MNMNKTPALLFSTLLLAVTAGAQAAPSSPAAQPRQSVQQHGVDAEKYDTKLPIEISSDTLEVLQHENKAIFKGNVVAVQGQVRLKSDTMTVHYKQKSGEEAGKQPKPAARPADKNAANGQGDMGAITSIDVDGNVFMATPRESAKGDRGDYDVPTRTLHLYGANVVLTRDKNLMRGTALEYNMETGRSILTNGTTVNGGSTGTRVRSVFVPNQEQEAGKPGK